jgi:AcrR family transcriptional regulator
LETSLSGTVVEDQRVRRTKAALLGAFFDLVLRRRYDQMSVAEIVGRAGVARSTFYEHYQSKDELLREGLSAPFGILAEAAFEPGFPLTLTETVAHFWENRRIARVLFAGRRREIVTRILADLITRQFARRGLTEQRLGAPPSLLAQQLANGQIGMLAAWLAGQAPCTSSAMAKALYRTASGALAAVQAGDQA